MTQEEPPPKLFISYSWTSPQHEQWVVELAEKLVNSGVDVVFDKWGLKEGHSKIAFMEQMDTNDSIRKVIMIINKDYAEKANARIGGVGTETEIISKKIYDQQKQDKFVALVLEKDAKGEPYLPAYYKSRIYIDFPESYGEKEFKKLLRWIFNKPSNIRPDLGKPPAFVSDEARNSIPATVAQRSATKAIKNYKGNSSNQTIYDDMVKHINKSGDPFSAWHCGITSDPKRRLFKEHNVSKDNGSWKYSKCDNHTGARSVEKALLEHGCDGGGGGGDASSIFVYVYKKTPPPVKAFISHSITDKKYANALRTAFKKYHIDAFVSSKDIKAGQLWQKKIRAEINDMKIFIAIHTNAFSASLWCQQETGMALARENEVVIIPIKSKLQKVPQSVLTNFQYIDRGTKNTETVVKEIIDMLKTSDKIKINT